MTVRFSARADADIIGIKAYIAADNASRATTFARELVLSCLAIGEVPLAHRKISRTRLTEVRRKNHKGYAIIYRIGGSTIEIVRVLHGARDIARILRAEDR